MRNSQFGASAMAGSVHPFDVLSSRTSTAKLGLFLITFWTLMSSVVEGTHPYLSNSGSHGNLNCAFMNACDVTETLMQEINALKEKLAELVNFQVDVNQFKFEHGIHRSEMEQFRQHVESFMKNHAPQPHTAHVSGNHDNVTHTSHADAPNHGISHKDAMSLPAIHNRLEQVENTVRQWDENVLSSTRTGETLRQTLEREEGTRKVLEEKIGHLQKKVDDVQTLFKEEKTKSETMKNELWDLKQATNKQETALGRHQDVMQNVNRTLRVRVTELEENMGFVSSSLAQLSYRGDEFMENISREVETVKKTTNSKFANVTGQVDRLTSQQTYLAAELRNVSKEVGFIGGDINEVKMQVETFVGRMFTFDMLFTKHNRELQSVLKSVKETNVTMQQIWQTMGSVAEEVDNLKADVTNWEDALNVFNASVLTNSQEIESVWQVCDSNLTDLRRLLHVTDLSLDDFRGSIAIDVKRLMANQKDLDKRMDDTENSQKWMENEVKAYELQAGKYESEIDYIRQQISAESANMKTLKNNIKYIENSLDAVRKYQTELKGNVTELMQNLIPLLPTPPVVIDTTATTMDLEYNEANLTTTAEPTDDSDANEDGVIAEPLKMQGEEPSSSGCLFTHLAHPNVVTSIRGRPIRSQWMLEVKEGEEIAHRCKDIGAFSMTGAVQQICLKNGSWTGTQPVCQKLTTADDFMGGAMANIAEPPVIEIFPAPGSLSSTGVTPTGSLIVTPGSRVSFGCVFPKNGGVVSWTFTPSSGTLGVSLAGRWSQEIRYELYHLGSLEITLLAVGVHTVSSELISVLCRVSESHGRPLLIDRNEIQLQSARPDNSGHYTCKKRKGGQHTIHVLVQDVNCSPPPENPQLHIQDPVKLRLNSRLEFACKQLGYVLTFPDAENYNSTSTGDDGNDDDDFRCLASGEWSRDFPTCIRKFRRGG